MKKQTSERDILNKFNNDPSYKKDFCNKLVLSLALCPQMKECKKENNFQAIHTDEWEKLKEGTKETNATPKTDKIITDENGKIAYKISFKDKKGRLTSADCYETTAILSSVWNNKHSQDNIIKKLIDDISEAMKKLGKYKPKDKTFTMTKAKKILKKGLPEDEDNPDILWVKKLLNTKEYCIKIWEELFNNHIEYVKDVLFECASGQYKFGDNCGRANILMITNGTKIKEIFNMEKRTTELDEYLLKCLPCKTSIFACKSGGTGKDMWIRFL